MSCRKVSREWFHTRVKLVTFSGGWWSPIRHELRWGRNSRETSGKGPIHSNYECQCPRGRVARRRALRVNRSHAPGQGRLMHASWRWSVR